MDELVALLAQRVAELLADRSKSHAIDNRAVARFETNTEMRLPHFIRKNELMGRQCKYGLGIAAAKRTRAIEHCHKLRRRSPRRNRPIDEEFIDVPRLRDIMRKSIFHVGAEVRELLLQHRHAGCHRMAAPLIEYAIYHFSAHSPSEIDTGDRAAGPGAGPARLKRD